MILSASEIGRNLDTSARGARAGSGKINLTERIQAPDPRKQTLASKVLGAIALERVTGPNPIPRA
jgi:hypothetical protein